MVEEVVGRHRRNLLHGDVERIVFLLLSLDGDLIALTAQNDAIATLPERRIATPSERKPLKDITIATEVEKAYCRMMFQRSDRHGCLIHIFAGPLHVRSGGEHHFEDGVAGDACRIGGAHHLIFIFIDR